NHPNSDKLAALLCRERRLDAVVNLVENQVQRFSAASYATVLQLCIEKKALDEGKIVVAQIKASGFVPGTFVSNRILDLFCKCGSLFEARTLFDEMNCRDLCSWNIMLSGYTKCGLISDARNMFDEMPQRDNFTWTALISGYVKHNEPEHALELYRLMHEEEISSACDNKFTISIALAASASLKSLCSGKEIHGRIIRTSRDSDAVVWSALLDMYGKCGSVNEARHIFDTTPDKDIVSWTTMMDCYFGDGKWTEGFSLFSHLLSCSGNEPNDFTISGVLKACTFCTAEEIGRQVHARMMLTGFSPDSFAASTLVHMYTKCGSIESARKVFSMIPEPDLVSWTSLINGYAQNGQHREALRLFDLLLESGNRPDHITFVGVLSACTHAGLVSEGLEYFHSITEKHGLSHTPDHYACVVDLLSRAGRFEEAENVINEMPMKPDRFIWGSLLNGCRIHGNYVLAKEAAEALLRLEPDNAATYVTLANIYASEGKWDEAGEMRKVMEEGKAVKKPGMSWISMKRKTHVFSAGDQPEEIVEFLKEVSKRMKEEGYIPETNLVAQDVEEEQKEEILSYHSEKLAVAFGIINSSAGREVKVFKNLRSCVDCHTAIKFISGMFQRRIIVRDSTRFHCFQSGCCSCRDYW
ncbi:hypothetical protein M569_03380, partial [Genlisea aurea]